jgi:subtilisin family serine protease
MIVFLLLLGGHPAAVLGDEYESGEIEVELAPGIPVSAINNRYGTTTLDSLPPLYLLQCPHGGETELLDQIADDPDVLEAEYSWESETPEGTRQMVVAAVGGTIVDYLDQHLVQRIRLADIQAHTLGDGILVAVIDTGVLATHPALLGAVVDGGFDFVDHDTDPTDSTNGVDDDLDGTIDEGAGHGSMVAGIVHLVAPSAKILPIRVLDDEGLGKAFRVAQGIRYAVEHGADVINLSLGLTGQSSVIRREVRSAESLSIPIVSAAGNLGVETPQLYPAADGRVLSVAALDSSDVKAGFSGWNSSVDISAPGVGVMSAYHDGGYAIGAGTSFSAPFVSGQCALIRALAPALTASELYGVAMSGVTNIYDIPGNEPYEEKLGSGRFDGLQTWLNVQAATSAVGLALQPSSDLAIFPNPAPIGSFITLRSGERATKLVVDVAIYDGQGRLVRGLSQETEGGLFLWDGRDAAEGRSV